MDLKRKLISGALVGGLAVAGMVATTPSAAAVGGCPTGKLCLYENINYVDLDVTSTSTKACIDLGDFGEHNFEYGIGSYVNNLSVKAAVYHWGGVSLGYVHDGTISPGGFSSNSTNGDWFGEFGMVCTGGATP
jgi:hypothetical protein